MEKRNNIKKYDELIKKIEFNLSDIDEKEISTGPRPVIISLCGK